MISREEQEPKVVISENNKNEKEEKPRVIVHWNTTQFKPTIYDVETFHQVKQKSSGGDGYYLKVFNPSTNQFEFPARIDPLPPMRRKKGKD